MRGSYLAPSLEARMLPLSLLCFCVLLDSAQNPAPKIKLSEEPTVIVSVGCVIKTCHLQKKKKSSSFVFITRKIIFIHYQSTEFLVFHWTQSEIPSPIHSLKNHDLTVTNYISYWKTEHDSWFGHNYTVAKYTVLYSMCLPIYISYLHLTLVGMGGCLSSLPNVAEWPLPPLTWHLRERLDSLVPR